MATCPIEPSSSSNSSSNIIDQHLYTRAAYQRFKNSSLRTSVFSSLYTPRCIKPISIKCQADQSQQSPIESNRRQTLAAIVATSLLTSTPAAHAIQGSIAGRIPGITGPDKDGYYLYTRPEGKSGGHGVGWSEIPRYSFKVPEGWEETPVSIADLGGTEIDLRYGKEDCGSALVIVAPVLRFADIGFNADVKIDELGTPDKIIAGFAPELYGSPLQDDDVLDTHVYQNKGLTYYSWELKPHKLVTATADGNRMFILSIQANSRQWRKAQPELRVIQESFYVPPIKQS